MQLKSNLFVAVASIAWLASPCALSQEPPADSPPPSPDRTDPAPTESAAQDVDQGASSTLSDQKIDQFANAYIEVQTIQQKASAELESKTDPAAADQVTTAAQTDMIAAVERSGLSIEEFNQIAQSLASNVELRNRVAAKLQERSGG